MKESVCVCVYVCLSVLGSLRCKCDSHAELSYELQHYPTFHPSSHHAPCIFTTYSHKHLHTLTHTHTHPFYMQFRSENAGANASKFTAIPNIYNSNRPSSHIHCKHTCNVNTHTHTYSFKQMFKHFNTCPVPM